jgi:hypothetical protein
MPYRRGYKGKRSVPLIHIGDCGFSQEPAQRTSCAKDAQRLAAGSFTLNDKIIFEKTYLEEQGFDTSRKPAYVGFHSTIDEKEKYRGQMDRRRNNST